MVIAQTHPPELALDGIKTQLTLEEYRAIEETAEERHEYRNREIITMPGGSESHSGIDREQLVNLLGIFAQRHRFSF